MTLMSHYSYGGSQVGEGKNDFKKDIYGVTMLANALELLADFLKVGVKENLWVKKVKKYQMQNTKLEYRSNKS